jgi:hypothetical protein
LRLACGLVGLGILAGVVLLATVGFAQGLVLGRHIDRSGSWVVANALGWVAGMAAVSAAIGIAPGNSPDDIQSAGQPDNDRTPPGPAPPQPPLVGTALLT